MGGCSMASVVLFLPTASLRRNLPPQFQSRSVPIRFFPKSIVCQISSSSSAMQVSKAVPEKDIPLGMDPTMLEEYASQAKLLQEFTSVPSVDKAWIFKSDNANTSRAMFSMSQSNLLANKRRKYVLSSHISKPSEHSAHFEWSPFPTEMTGVSTVVPSPSGSKLLVVRNAENDSPTKLEIWSLSQLEKEIHIPQSVHGSLYVDGWFEGISWNHEESLIAYVAEEPPLPRPVFNDLGYKQEGSSEKDCGSWKGQGDWEEDWGETYSKKRNPSLFVVNIASGEVRAVEGISRSLSVGQVIWSPSSSNGCLSYLVFVGWSSENNLQKTPRKLGIKYCYNRPCALYAICNPYPEGHVATLNGKNVENSAAPIKLTNGLSSAFFPKFSPDGKYLVFLSAQSAVDSGVHSATNSLHKIEWPADRKLQALQPFVNIINVVPVVMCPEDSCFPGLYCLGFLADPWLSDGCTMILSSFWRSMEVILSVNILSCKVSRISPQDSSYSWDVLALDGDNVLAVASSPIDPPKIKYGYHMSEQTSTWTWVDVSTPFLMSSSKVGSLLSEHKFSILKIPVGNPSNDLSNGGKLPFEAIFISCKDGATKPTITILHGGPHSVSLTRYSKSLAFLSSLGYNMLIVNYRGSLGFGEEALQSLPGKAGSQDVDDVLTALDYVIEKGLVDASKVAVLGGSHGGFLTTHLIGQAPDKFVVAAARNPVCNISLMVGTTDIPDWCYVEACGTEGKNYFTESPSAEYLTLFYKKSPISHISKVKTPILFLVGAQDLRVPVSNGLQYARTLRERGVEVKVIVFPEDVHGIDRPQSDFESFLNIGVWFKKYCK